jgi:hypothetical protein
MKAIDKPLKSFSRGGPSYRNRGIDTLVMEDDNAVVFEDCVQVANSPFRCDRKTGSWVAKSPGKQVKLL